MVVERRCIEDSRSNDRTLLAAQRWSTVSGEEFTTSRPSWRSVRRGRVPARTGELVIRHRLRENSDPSGGYLGRAVVEDLANGYHARGPWNMYPGGLDAYDTWLRSEDRKPEHRVYLPDE